ncbi:hypothetical protein LWI28_005650 [Acer negundo]|uniref:Uncharacterized protein n=1 Tax=Acer negundo TaxID=4023 RepID=A0AAD5ID41_ACENE|nr:hypothetical protein LWI28_005650 [Acer negundo]
MGGIRGEAVSIMKKKNVNEKWKKSNFKKPPKPPRPHGVLSLDEADMKMVKEISELARLKHVKALKKKRIHKASSSIVVGVGSEGGGCMAGARADDAAALSVKRAPAGATGTKRGRGVAEAVPAGVTSVGADIAGAEEGAGVSVEVD